MEAEWNMSYIKHDKPSKREFASQFLSALGNRYKYICTQQMDLMECDNSTLVLNETKLNWNNQSNQSNMSGFADVFFSWNYWVKQPYFKRERGEGEGWGKRNFLQKREKTKVISSGKDINTILIYLECVTSCNRTEF